MRPIYYLKYLIIELLRGSSWEDAKYYAKSLVYGFRRQK